MNRDEARTELDATTLRPQDASAEARETARRDPELGAWLERRTAFDEKVAAAMADMPVPGSLQAQLLAAMNAEAAGGVSKPRQRRVFMGMPVAWMAAAAVAVLAGFAIWFVQPSGPGWMPDALAKVKLIDHGLMRLEHRSRKLDDLKLALVKDGSLSPGKLPSALAGLRTYGCRVIQVKGRPATVVCFQIASGEEAHLVVMKRADLPSPPPVNQPQFVQEDGWQVAAWSDESQSYALMTRASADKLRALFRGDVVKISIPDERLVQGERLWGGRTLLSAGGWIHLRPSLEPSSQSHGSRSQTT